MKADDYAIRFWKQLLTMSLPCELPFGTTKLRRYVVSADLLHTFCMQTLLRSFLSKRWEHDQVDLTANKDDLIQKLRGGQSTIVDGPEISLECIKEDKAANVMTPYVAIHGGNQPIYQLSFPHLVASIAVDRNLPSWYGPTVLRANEPVTVWHRRRLNEAEVEIVDGFYRPNQLRVTKIMG